MKKYLNIQYWMIKNFQGAQDNEFIESAYEIIVSKREGKITHSGGLQ